MYRYAVWSFSSVSPPVGPPVGVRRATLKGATHDEESAPCAKNSCSTIAHGHGVSTGTPCDEQRGGAHIACAEHRCSGFACSPSAQDALKLSYSATRRPRQGGRRQCALNSKAFYVCVLFVCCQKKPHSTDHESVRKKREKKYHARYVTGSVTSYFTSYFYEISHELLYVPNKSHADKKNHVSDRDQVLSQTKTKSLCARTATRRWQVPRTLNKRRE